MSQLEYNEILLQYVRTTQFVQDMVYDASGTDYLYTRFFIEVECVWSPDVFPAGPAQIPGNLAALIGKQPVISMVGPGYPNAAPIGSIAGLRPYLMAPRKRLVFSDDDNNILVQSPRAKDGNGPEEKLIPQGKSPLTDDKLGPHPKHLNIVQLHGSDTYIIHYAIETHIVECQKGPGGPLLSNRWRESMHIDRQMFQSRTHSGKLIMRGGAFNFLDPKAVLSADQYRNWAFPPIPEGFVRNSIDINLSENGLELGYNITDKQQYRITDPQGVATEIQASYTERTGNGILVDSEINIHIKGTPYSNARDLISLACIIALTRIGVAKDKNKKFDPTGNVTIGGIPFSGSIRENLMEPEIDMHLQIKKTIRDISFKTGQTAGKVKEESAKKDLDESFKFGIASSNLGIRWLPGTSTSNLVKHGLSPGSFGAPTDRPAGVVLIAQMLSSPCRKIACATTEVLTLAKPPQESRNSYTLKAPDCNDVPRAGGNFNIPSPATDNAVYGPPAGDNGGAANIIVAVTVNLVKEIPEEQRTQFSDETLTFMYTNYAVDVIYDTDQRTIMLPVAKAGIPAARFIRVAGATGQKIVRWTAERAGKWPDLPTPVTNNSNEVLLHKRIVPIAAELLPDLTDYIYKASGEYVYGLRTPVDESTDGLQVAALPYTRAKFADNAVPGASFVNGIIDPLPANSTRTLTMDPLAPG